MPAGHDTDAPRKKKKKPGAASQVLLYVGLGVVGFLVVVGLIVLTVLVIRARRRPAPADNHPDQAQARNDDKPRGPDRKPDAPPAPKGGPGVKLDDLPVWTADAASVKDLDPNEQAFSRFVTLRMKVPTQWQDHPMNNEYRSIGPLVFMYKFGEMRLNYGTWTYTGLAPGKHGPKEHLRNWLGNHRDQAVKNAGAKIEMGRSGNMALARCLVPDAKQPTFFWVAVFDTSSVIMEVNLDTRVDAKYFPTLIKLFEASILSAHK
jgi:hypothetical protein